MVDNNLKQLIQELESSAGHHPHFKWKEGILTRKGKVVIGDDAEIRESILIWMHSSHQGGHSGIEVTTKRIKSMFYWPKLKQTVTNFVKKCIVCQKCKADLSAYLGLLQPLPIPNDIWEEVTIDFIEGLPKSQGKEVNMVVIDRLSKYAHFLALSHPFSAITVAQTYMNHVYKLHGFPQSIVSDRDKVFISHFWTELMKIQGVHHKLSTSYHP